MRVSVIRRFSRPVSFLAAIRSQCAAAPAERAARDFARLPSMRSGGSSGQNDAYPPTLFPTCIARSETRLALRLMRRHGQHSPIAEDGGRHQGDLSATKRVRSSGRIRMTFTMRTCGSTPAAAHSRASR